MALPAQAATLLLEAHSEKNKRPDEALFFLGPQVSEWFVEIYLGWFIFLRTMSGWENPRVWLKKKKNSLHAQTTFSNGTGCDFLDGNLGE